MEPGGIGLARRHVVTTQRSTTQRSAEADRPDAVGPTDERASATNASTNAPTKAVGYVGGRLLAQMLEFVLWVVAVQRLELEAVGILAIGLLAARYAGFLGDWGASFAGPREVAKYGVDSDVVGSLIRRREFATLFASFAFVSGAVLVDQAVLWPLVGQILLRGLNRDWIGLALGHPIRAVSANLVAQVLALALGLTLAPDLMPVAFGAGGLAGLVLSIVLNPRRVQRRGPASSVGAGGWYAIAGLAGLTYTTADTFLLGILRTSDEVAIYASVYRLPNAWLLLIGLAVGATVPRVSALLMDADAVAARLLRRRLTQAAVAGVAIVAIATPAALWLTPLLFGSEFEAGREPLLILMGATAIVTFGAPFQILVISSGNDRRAAAVMAGAAGINVVANLVVIPAYGMNGAAWTTVATQAIPAAYYWLNSSKNPA